MNLGLRGASDRGLDCSRTWFHRLRIQIANGLIVFLQSPKRRIDTESLFGIFTSLQKVEAFEAHL